MRKFSVFFVTLMMVFALTACGNDSNKLAEEDGNNNPTITEATNDLDRPDDSDIVSPEVTTTVEPTTEATNTTEVTETPTTEAPIPTNPGEHPTREPDVVMDDVKMWDNGDGTYTYSLYWDQAWLTYHTNVFDYLEEGEDGLMMFKFRTVTEGYGWTLEWSDFYQGDNRNIHLYYDTDLDSNDMEYVQIIGLTIDNSPNYSITNRYTDYSNYSISTTGVRIRITDFIFLTYTMEMINKNPNTDPFVDIIPAIWAHGDSNYIIGFDN